MMTLEILSAKAVEYFLMQVAGGALDRLGSDAAEYLEKLLGIVYSRFAGKPELAAAKDNPEILAAKVKEEISNDSDLREQLEMLVEKLVYLEQLHNSTASHQAPALSINIPGNNNSTQVTQNNTQNNTNFFRQ